MNYRERITQFERSDAIPTPDDYPGTPWTHECKLGDKYLPAFDAATQEDADIHLWMLVGHSLRYGHHIDKAGMVHKMTWAQAFAYEREQIAWFALARDVKDGKHQVTEARDFAARYYSAKLPKSVTAQPDEADILERVHIKRAKSAASKGATYWRKVHEPAAEPVQGGLF